MNTPHALTNDPILALLPEVRGRRILKPCVLYARLGRGGMGAVYLGKHLTLTVKQVVKCLWLWGQGQNTGDEFIERFHQEARIAAELSHQNLVRVTHVDRCGELHYLVMEYVAGEDARRRVQRRGALSEPQALRLLLGAAQGLGFAHGRGIVHRDIKPANLMISLRGEVKVIDLGLARALDAGPQLTATQGTLGTPQFMAPEQWDSARVGPQADVWALGATLYYLLCGRSHVPAELDEPSAIRRFVSEQPFPDLRVVGATISDATRRVLARCVARDPAQRYADGRELAAALLPLAPTEDQILVDAEGVPPMAGDEPDDAELRALQAELEQGPDAAGLTRVMPQERPATASGSRTRTATPAPEPTHTFVAPTPPRRRRAWPVLVALLVALALGSAGVVAWLRPDPVELQKDAITAIYQERFADAVALLRQLETFPAFADQARRLGIDALVKDAERLKAQQPAAALTALDEAAAVAERLLLPKDADDSRARIAALRSGIETQVRERIAAAVTVLEPLRDTLVTRAQIPVAVQVATTDLDLVLRVAGQPLAADSGGTHRGHWPAPAVDGDSAVQVVCEARRPRLQHTVSVPVRVKRAPVTLTLTPPATALVNGDGLELGATVQNGPVDVLLDLWPPSGPAQAQALGSRDGASRFTVAFPAGQDGEYRLALRAVGPDQDLRSDECRVRVDRVPPALLRLEGPPAASGQTVLLRGMASEPCRVFVRDLEADAVATDAAHEFVLPVPLPAVDGPTTIQVLARDLAGNPGARTWSLTLTVDRTAPALVGALRHAPVVNGAALTIAGQLSEPGTVWVGDAEPATTGDDGRFTLAAELPAGVIEVSVPLRLHGRDLAGNALPPQHLSVFVDRRGPTILPGAVDGGWWSEGRLLLKLEDPSGPCRASLGPGTQQADGQGRVEFALPASSAEVEVVATDGLGNTTRRSLPRPRSATHGSAPPGPAWGQPVAGAGVDPDLWLHERVAVAIGKERLVLRLVRPLREEELPPAAQRDAKAVALLQGRGPFYLAETEVPVAVWAEHVAARGEAPGGTPRLVFNPATCQAEPLAAASWRAPLHPTLLAKAPTDRGRWPVTQVTPAEARAFCDAYGLRLPTEQEWWFVVRMGCRGRYGWGAGGALEQRANFADLGLKQLVPGLATFEPVADGFATLAPVDALPGAEQAHPWGFTGLLGNAAEWCVTHKDRVVARGGSWLSEPRELRVDELRADGLITTGAWDHVGFRVARDP